MSQPQSYLQTTCDASSLKIELPEETSASLPARMEASQDTEHTLKRKEKKTQASEFLRVLLEALDYHKVPLTVILSLLVFPQLMLLWVPFIMLWSLAEIIYPRLPEATRDKIKSLLPAGLESNRWFTEMRAGVGQVRPFVLIAIYFGCAPIALVWMFWHWLRSLLPHKTEPKRGIDRQDELVVFVQKKEVSKKDEETNFFHSPAFTLTAIGLFGCGLPAAITYLLYRFWGIDAILGYPSHDPRFNVIIVIVGFYLMSLAWSLMTLFLRAWLTFPLNFMDNEDEVHLSAKGLEKKSQNWFARVLTYNCAFQSADSLEWKDIRTLNYEATMRYYPLPDRLLDADSILYKILNRLAAFYDSIIDSVGRAEKVSFSTAAQAGFTANKISLNLAELTGEERARLFYATRKFGPHVTIDEGTQEKLLGSAVLREPQYTQIWFDLLTSKPERKRQTALQQGDILDDRYKIVERIASGGQANAYLAHRAHQNENQDQNKYVLKEFILSSSDAVGALLESAREFESEASLLSLLEHPHIVKKVDFFAEDRRAYLVLEHIEGKTLRQIVQERGPLEENQVIELARQMCEVLSYMHLQEPPVIHRDFSPDNIILHETRGIVLIDFSLSGSGTGRGKRTVVGKHSYTPPEQFREQACPQSDIYALGATLFFLLTGRDPKPISCSSPKAAKPGVSNEMNEIVEKATSIDLEKRYANISWLQLDLQSLVQTADVAPYESPNEHG